MGEERNFVDIGDTVTSSYIPEFCCGECGEMFEVKEKFEKHSTEHDNTNFTIYSEQELICMVGKDFGILKRKKRNVSETDYTNIIETFQIQKKRKRK